MHVTIEEFEMPSAEDVEAVAARLRLLGDPTRLRIVCALGQGESDVGCLAKLAGVGMAAVSQHLSKLRLAGVVRGRREGQRKIYELTDGWLHDLTVDLFRVPETAATNREVRA